jgi:hypothetical protein
VFIKKRDLTRIGGELGMWELEAESEGFVFSNLWCLISRFSALILDTTFDISHPVLAMIWP